MGSIRHAESASSSSSSPVCPENSPSMSDTRQSGTSVAVLRSRFESLRPAVADQRAINGRRGSGEGTSGSAETATAVVNERKSKGRSTLAQPAAVSWAAATRHSLETTLLPVNRGRPVIPTDRKSREQKQTTSPDDRGDYCGRTKCYAGVESILKKDREPSISTDFHDPSVRQRRQEAINVVGLRGKSRGCSGGGNAPRRVLFKNNVSVYRFDAEPPPRGRPNAAARSNGVCHDAVLRPPTLPGSYDVLVNRRCRRSAATVEPDDGRVLLNLLHRQTDRLVADNSSLSPSSAGVVGNFEVYVDHQHGNHRLCMSIRLPSTRRPIDADRLLVKASRCGTRIRVVSDTQNGNLRHGADDELNEQLALPVTVDPYGVTARLERDRVLIVEAPVVVL